MKVYVKSVEKEAVEVLKKKFYKMEAKRDLLESVINPETTAQSNINNAMLEIFIDRFDKDAIAYKEEFLKFSSMVPYEVEMQHEIKISVSFIKNRLEVLQFCECNIDDIMHNAGFEILNITK